MCTFAINSPPMIIANPNSREIREMLLRSREFLDWEPLLVNPRKSASPTPRTKSRTKAKPTPKAKIGVSGQHYSPAELAEAWGVSVETVRSIFRGEPGVLKLGKTGTRYRRSYYTLRIPQEVAERVHRRLSA
jgi:hypothetical protein